MGYMALLLVPKRYIIRLEMRGPSVSEDKRLGDGEGALAMTELIWGVPKISILGSTLGLPYFGKLPYIPGITPASISCLIFLSI